MARASLSRVARLLRRSVGRQVAGGTTTDADLLHRFVAEGDEAAFELLVWRHERMVRGVCWRVLRHAQDVDKEAAAEALKEIDVTMTQDKDAVRIIASRPERKDQPRGQSQASKAEVRVPAGAVLSLKWPARRTAGVRFAGTLVNGDHTFLTSNGRRPTERGVW